MAKQDKVNDVLSTAPNNFDSEDDSYLDSSVSLAARLKEYYTTACPKRQEKNRQPRKLNE